MKKTAGWTAFPYPSAAFDYPAGALKKHWARIHRGDKEPYPSAQHLAKLCKGNQAIARSIPGFDGDFDALSQRSLEAWRLYHRGDFEQAARLGSSLGFVGYAAADKATLVYATYLAEGTATRLKLFEGVIARAEEAIRAMPADANAHYLYAAAMGRHSQKRSVLEALAEGLAGKIRSALERTLDLAPEHAEAHMALGTYHAEILGKVGSLIGGLTYGASADDAIAHYEKALALHPHSAIARVEYAHGLRLMFGDRRADRAAELYGEAAKLEPCDAMERLDVELAKSRLKDL